MCAFHCWLRKYLNRKILVTASLLSYTCPSWSLHIEGMVDQNAIWLLQCIYGTVLRCQSLTADCCMGKHSPWIDWFMPYPALHNFIFWIRNKLLHDYINVNDWDFFSYFDGFFFCGRGGWWFWLIICFSNYFFLLAFILDNVMFE